VKPRDLKLDKYLLIDFNCAHESTHHWSSMVVYGEFIDNKGVNVEFWVPKYTHANISRVLLPIGPVKKILSSPQYGATKLRKFPMAFLLQKIAAVSTKHGRANSLVGGFVRKLITIYCILPVLLKVVQENREFKLKLVFPTLDYMGIKLIEVIEDYLSDLDIFVRRMGSETRSPFSNGDELTNFIKLIDNASRNRISMGIPTIGLLKEIKTGCEKPNQIHWSPLPPRFIPNKLTRVYEIPLAIGFPGTAKKSKGYGKIPRILEQLSSEGIQLKVFLQGALYPWDGYLEIRKEILSSNHDVIELESVLSIPQYEILLSKLDLIVLPYESEFYTDADSGILYEAADREIPLFCEDNLGFSEEALTHGIGFSMNKIGNLREALEKALSPQTNSNIKLYNSKRTEALEAFLFGEQNLT